MKTKSVVVLVLAAIAAAAVYAVPGRIEDRFSCAAPSGAMNAIEYRETFIGTLREIHFSCYPLVRGVCQSYLCTEFTAVDDQDKHVIGYFWRNVVNKPEATTCSPDGGKSGTFYGECPVGSPAPTVYRCPWCEPNPDAVADTRGIR